MNGLSSEVCLNICADDSPTEMISVVICSDDEMTESIDNGDGGLEEVDESVLTMPLMDGHGTSRDLSNEEYLMQFEQKFCQATDFGGYNISSVSSSLNSSSDSSLYIVTQAERKDEFWLSQEDKKWNGSEHRSQTEIPSSLADADTGDDYDAAASCHRLVGWTCGSYSSSHSEYFLATFYTEYVALVNLFSCEDPIIR